MVTGQAAAQQPGLPVRSLVLQLVIADTEPLSGSVGLERQPAARMGFSGWIGLMSAINGLRTDQPDAPADPGDSVKTP